MRVLWWSLKLTLMNMWCRLTPRTLQSSLNWLTKTSKTVFKRMTMTKWKNWLTLAKASLGSNTWIKAQLEDYFSYLRSKRLKKVGRCSQTTTLMNRNRNRWRRQRLNRNTTWCYHQLMLKMLNNNNNNFRKSWIMRKWCTSLQKVILYSNLSTNN